ncbi:MAG TPA: aminopeptidase N [Actinomycetales bacterium]|nr:aminopeptidase N [Actinomycetales bacterium]
MNLTRDEARERAAHLSVSSYEIDLDLTVGEETFGSTTTVRFSSNRPGSNTFIDLVAPSVRRVLLNGTELDPAEVADGTRVQLPSVQEENELVVEASCAYMNTGEGLHRFVDPVDKEVYLYSQFEVADARRVFAVFDQPDLKATFTFTVTAPSHWQVISNSPSPQPTEAAPGVVPGSSTWRFAPTPRLAPYVTAIVAGPYHVERGELTSRDGRVIPLGVFCRASLAEHLDADNVMDVTRRGFEYFERVFDVAYPFEKYDQLFVPEFNAGAMENAGAVTFVESYVFRSKVPEAMVERRALTILHELAHMWFGDLVTMRWWDDLWLNESFAEYASTVCLAEATRWTSAWTTFSSMEKSWAYRQDQLPSTHPVVADMVDLEAVEVNFDGITYAKGASVLRQLVAYVGRDHFEEGLRRYFRQHAWGNTELGDLLAELEATSGRDLRAWSRVWLERAGVTTLRPELEVDDAGTITSLAVRQEVPDEHPTHRPHRLAIGCYDLVDGVMTRTRQVELDVDGELTPVPELVGAPRPDLLLVNDDDLAYAKVRLDETSMATAVARLDAFTDSLPRTLIWGAAWDMTRDAELAGRDFVDLVLGNVAAETDSSVVLVLLRQLTTTIRLYVAPEHRDAVATAAAERLLALARQAEAGSDTQLQLVKAFAAQAISAEQLDAVAALLSGDEQLEGLSIDTDLRWELLTSLVVGGRAAEDEIDRELERDDTAAGRRAAAAARAAVPTEDAKRRAWASVVDSDDLPNAVQASVIAGFGRVHDTSLLKPFVEPYFAALPQVWASRTNEMAQQIVVGLYPTLLADEQTVERTDAFLQSLNGDTTGLRRLTLENRDGVLRALRAQARDRAAH